MSINPVQIQNLKPLHDSILVSDMQFAERITHAGLIIPSDNGKVQGIHPRWGKVYAIGPEQKDVKVGQWVCVSHGRWTRGIKVVDQDGEHEVRRIDNKDILLVSDEQQFDENMGQPI